MWLGEIISNFVIPRDYMTEDTMFLSSYPMGSKSV